MNSMPFRQLKSFFKILIGVQYQHILRQVGRKRFAAQALDCVKAVRNEKGAGHCPAPSACQKSPQYTLSFRTSPQTGVGIPRIEAKAAGLGSKMFENSGGIATAVCALPRNDMVFRQSDAPSPGAQKGISAPAANCPDGRNPFFLWTRPVPTGDGRGG